MSQKQRQALRRQQLLLDRQALLTQPAFCRVMQDVLEATGVFRSTFAGEQTHAMAFQEGQRNIGLKLFAEFSEADPRFLLLLKEHALTDPTTPEDEGHD